MSQLDRRLLIGAAGVAGVAAISRLAQAGPLSPPAGPVSSTGRTLSEIYDKVARSDAGLAEPRIPVQSLPGNATATHVIAQPGSYYLTDNITGAAGKHGIEVAAPNVSLDLMGFSLVGSSGDTIGIKCTLQQQAIVVHGGFIADWAGGGLSAVGREAVVFGVVFERCGGGAEVGAGSRIADCTFRDNIGPRQPVGGGDWIIVDRCVLLGGWGNEGIATYRRSIVRDCVIDGGFSTGILAEDGCLITGCDVKANFGGITARAKCRVVGNLCRDMLTGIHTQSGSSDVQDNTCVGVDYGVHVEGSDGSNISGNTIAATNTGVLVNGGSTRCVILGNRVRSTAATPYAIPSGNAYGPIVNIAAAGNIAAVANANHPWANFTY